MPKRSHFGKSYNSVWSGKATVTLSLLGASGSLVRNALPLKLTLLELSIKSFRKKLQMFNHLITGAATST